MPHLQGLILAHPITDKENFEISLLIGSDHYWNFVGDHIIRGNGPIAMQSKLGYLLSGPLTQSQTQFSSGTILHVAAAYREDNQDFWNMEPTDTTGCKNSNDHFFLQYQNSCISREEDGGYTVKFPWKNDHVILPSNYAVCEWRTRSLACRLSQVPQLLETYGSIIAEYESRGFIEKVPESSSISGHYIPHHAVEKASSTTPIRIVFDCSCHQSKDHPSLNDCLMVGTPFQNDVCAIILRFRSHIFGHSTDIEKAFLHVNLHKDERDYTRFLWLSAPCDPESSFQTYRFKSILFGSTSSPFMLNTTLRCHLNKFKSPVADDMMRNLYVDNIISGSDPEEQAIQYCAEARSIMAKEKFNLRSWASNSNAVQRLAIADNVIDKDSNSNYIRPKIEHFHRHIDLHL